jgi:chorismate mutase/prephenate dehydratase
MNKDLFDLAKVRRDIDEVDSAIHNLLMKRAELVEGVKKAKSRSNISTYRPAREAEVLRIRGLKHKGKFPITSLFGVWREIMAASVAMQQEFTCAVWHGEDGVFVSIARDHFGAVTPQRSYSEEQGVIDAVLNGSHVVGLLPKPVSENGANWWINLYRQKGEKLFVCSSVPFLKSDRRPEALVVSKFAPEQSGDDVSYLILETDRLLEPEKLRSMFETCNFHLITTQHATLSGERGAVFLVLAEIEGFYAPGSQLSKDLLTNFDGIIQTVFVGSFPKRFGSTA